MDLPGIYYDAIGSQPGNARQVYGQQAAKLACDVAWSGDRACERCSPLPAERGKGESEEECLCVNERERKSVRARERERESV